MFYVFICLYLSEISSQLHGFRLHYTTLSYPEFTTDGTFWNHPISQCILALNPISHSRSTIEHNRPTHFNVFVPRFFFNELLNTNLFSISLECVTIARGPTTINSRPLVRYIVDGCNPGIFIWQSNFGWQIGNISACNKPRTLHYSTY